MPDAVKPPVTYVFVALGTDGTCEAFRTREAAEAFLERNKNFCRGLVVRQVPIRDQ